MSERPEYLRASQLADRLNVNVRTVRRWIADGTLPSIKIGGARLIAEADLLRIMQLETTREMPADASAESAVISMGSDNLVKAQPE